jgi:hypothetical protein
LQGKNKMAVKNGSTIQLPENRTIWITDFNLSSIQIHIVLKA